MNTESGKPVADPGTKPGSLPQEPRTCSVCGTKFYATADGGFCPVCILHGAAGGKATAAKVAGSASGSADSARETEGASPTRRFEHYEVMLGDDGKPVELGRGAMGVTYKAFDVDLHCPVTLKVISERYLGGQGSVRELRPIRQPPALQFPAPALPRAGLSV